MSRPWQKLTAGEQWSGWWETGVAGVSPLPVLAARGVHDGPAVVVTGAVHGDEYEGPAAIHKFFREVDTTQMHGLIIGLPVVNLSAWQARSRISPLDGVDLNQTFPGKSVAANGKPSEGLAYALFHTFVHGCDVLVDLHSGGIKLQHLPMIGWYAGDALAERLARGFGAPLHPWLMPNRAGVLSCEAHRAGKVAIGAEWGGGAGLDHAGVVAYTEGIRRLLTTLATPASQLFALDARQPIAGTYQLVEQGGLFVAAVTLGNRVAVGDSLGILYNLLGEPVATICAERSGLVAALAHNVLLAAGDRVVYLG
ncbi:MAG: succinylglutamate desuccinylase/aspartoacylase family protein [Caldilineaceae bacterium]